MPVTLLTGLGPVAFRRLSVDPPSANYVTQDEFLFIRTVADHAGPLIYVRVRLLRPSSEVLEIEREFRAINIFKFGEWRIHLTDGFLLSVAVSTDTLKQRGRQWVHIELRHGTIAETAPARVLISDYVQHQVPISWPEGPLRTPHDGRGYIYNPIMAFPAAGNNFLITVPVHAQWKVHTFTLVLTTDANVADRRCSLVADLGSGTQYFAQPADAHLASDTRRYVWSTAWGAYYYGFNTYHFPFPKDMALPGASRVRTIVTGLQVGDLFVDGGMIVEEWQTPY